MSNDGKVAGTKSLVEMLEAELRGSTSTDHPDDDWDAAIGTAIDIVREHEAKQPKEASENQCTLGVGDGRGDFFVHGDYESIKRVQEMIFKLEALKKTTEASAEVVERVARAMLKRGIPDWDLDSYEKMKRDESYPHTFFYPEELAKAAIAAMGREAVVVREHFNASRQALLEAVAEAFRPKQPAKISLSPLADHFAEESSEVITRAIRSLAAVAVDAFELFMGEPSQGCQSTSQDAEAHGAEDAATSSPAKITVVTSDRNAYVLLTNLAAKIEYEYVPPSGPIVTRSVPARRKPPYYDPGTRSVHVLPSTDLTDDAMIAITSGAAEPEDYGMRQVYPAKTSWTCPDCCVNPCKCVIYPTVKPGTFTTGDLKADSGWIEYRYDGSKAPPDAEVQVQFVDGKLLSGTARNIPWFLVERYRIVRDGVEG